MDHSTAAIRPAARWKLNRAGIINVYQYGNETLQFSRNTEVAMLPVGEGLTLLRVVR